MHDTNRCEDDVPDRQDTDNRERPPPCHAKEGEVMAAPIRAVPPGVHPLKIGGRPRARQPGIDTIIKRPKLSSRVREEGTNA